MKQRKKKMESGDTMGTMAYKPRSPHERMKDAARFAAREMVEASPAVRKLHNEIASAMHGAAKKVLSGRAERGSFR